MNLCFVQGVQFDWEKKKINDNSVIRKNNVQIKKIKLVLWFYEDLMGGKAGKGGGKWVYKNWKRLENRDFLYHAMEFRLSFFVWALILINISIIMILIYELCRLWNSFIYIVYSVFPYIIFFNSFDNHGKTKAWRCV